MRALAIIGLAAILTCGCTGQHLVYQDDLDKHTTVIAGVRTEVADATKALHATRTELEILEDRIERKTAELKQELGGLVAQVESRIGHIERRQTQVSADLQRIASHATEKNQAIVQAQEEVKTLRHEINQQVGSCKRALESVMAVVQSEPRTYRVKRGDTLDKIAKRHATTIEELKLANQLHTDTIFPEQELLLPRE